MCEACVPRSVFVSHDGPLFEHRGADVDRVIEGAVSMAKALESGAKDSFYMSVITTFNDVILFALPDSDPKAFLDAYTLVDWSFRQPGKQPPLIGPYPQFSPEQQKKLAEIEREDVARRARWEEELGYLF